MEDKVKVNLVQVEEEEEEKREDAKEILKLIILELKGKKEAMGVVGVMVEEEVVVMEVVMEEVAVMEVVVKVEEEKLNLKILGKFLRPVRLKINSFKNI